MSKMIKIISLILVLCSILSLSSVACASDMLDEIINKTSKKLIEIVPEPTISQIGGEWLVLALARSNYAIPDGYFDTYYKNVTNNLKKNKGILHDRKYTEYSRVVIALTAIGISPESTRGYDLIKPICDYEKVVWQGLNGPIFALIALDSNKYDPLNSKDLRKKYVDYIINSQNEDGGFSLAKTSPSDVDITSMAIIALSNYKEDKTVSIAINDALNFLSMSQTERGTFIAKGIENSQSSAQVLTALSTLGIKNEDERFIKNNYTVLDGLLSFYIDDQGFLNSYNDAKCNYMATEQCLYALVSYDRMTKGKNALYDMTDKIIENTETNEKITIGEYVHKMPITNTLKTFFDITNHESKMQIEELASRNIINGKSENIFDPDSFVTRAEFATIVVKALGLDIVTENIFSDVTVGDWHYSYIATAYKRGIVNGVSDALFNPSGIITKEESAVMVERGAKLCNINNAYDDIATRNILAAFTDYVSSASYARSSLAFCYDKGILDDSDIEINPKKYVTRAEITTMLYNLLELANLL